MKNSFIIIFLMQALNLCANQPKLTAVQALILCEKNKAREKLIITNVIIGVDNKGLILGDQINTPGVPLLGATDNKEVQELRNKALCQLLAHYRKK